MALAADLIVEVMFPNVGCIIPAKSENADVYYKGALVCFDADGYIVVAADTANFTFAGIVKEKVTVVSATKDLEIIRNTLAWIVHSGAAQTDVGALFHASADDTLTDGEGTNVGACGLCVAYKAGYLLIDFSQRTREPVINT